MSDTYDLNQELLAAFRSLMTPLIRILLRSGISFRDFAAVLKDVYVTICIREMARAGKPVSLPRVAIATGLTKREVESVVEREGSTQWGVGSHAELTASILETWHMDSAFVGPYGYPRDLKIVGPDESPTFEDLVRRFSTSVPPDYLVSELVRVGAARLLEGGGYIRVEKRTYIPTDMTVEMVQIFSQAVRRYIETVDFNLARAPGEERRFDRVVYPDGGLRLDDLASFKEEVRRYLENVIQDLDQKSSNYRKPAIAEGEASVQVGVGMYFFEEIAEDDRTPLSQLVSDHKLPNGNISES